ncbi:MAG: hypothetical protein ACLP5E_24365 [Streptosporangiaceae bacterium]|jgi:hypothetical protein
MAAQKVPLSLTHSADTDRRLRAFALVERMSLAEALDAALDAALPSLADLADRIRGSAQC